MSGITEYYDANIGETIAEFAKRIIEHRQKIDYDIVGRFKDVCIKVNPYVNEKYVVDYYYKSIGYHIKELDGILR